MGGGWDQEGEGKKKKNIQDNIPYNTVYIAGWLLHSKHSYIHTLQVRNGWNKNLCQKPCASPRVFSSVYAGSSNQELCMQAQPRQHPAPVLCWLGTTALAHS